VCLEYRAPRSGDLLWIVKRTSEKLVAPNASLILALASPAFLSEPSFVGRLARHVNTIPENLPAPLPAAIRSARHGDAPALAELLAILGYPASVGHVERRIAECATWPGTTIFVAHSGERVIGAISAHCIPMFHAPGSLGRITSLVVAPAFRQLGVGRLLVSAAEAFAWDQGCLRVEVTSGDHRPDAHAFYEHLGYKMDCRRFIKHYSNA